VSTATTNKALEKSLPSSYYYSAEMFHREKEYIFSTEWLCAGREEELPATGSFLVRDVAGESILIVRTNSGELKAHYNVCRHRGARLCGKSEEDRWGVKLKGGVTSAATIRCPYHQWTYGLDGSLLSVPFMQESDDFQKKDFSLYPVGLETWGGFFFLNLSPKEAAAEGQTLQSQMGPVQERIKRYPFTEMRTAKQINYELAANWKVVLENFNECYHCGPVHPELCEVVPDFKRGGGGLDWANGIPHREGATTFTWTGTTTRASFPGLDEFELVRHRGEVAYPNLLLSLSPDHVAAFLVWPQSAERTLVECRFLFYPDEIARADFDPADAVDFWDLINRQDWAICERVQTGLKTRIHKFGYYGPMEDDSADIRRYVAKHLGREAAD
jgi:Rieske 2Fe-2S family protein